MTVLRCGVIGRCLEVKWKLKFKNEKEHETGNEKNLWVGISYFTYVSVYKLRHEGLLKLVKQDKLWVEGPMQKYIRDVLSADHMK